MKQQSNRKVGTGFRTWLPGVEYGCTVLTNYLLKLESNWSYSVRTLLYLNLVTNALEEITKSHLCRSVEIGSNAYFVFPYLQFPSLFVPYDVKKCKIRCQLVWEDNILTLETSLVRLILNISRKFVFVVTYCEWDLQEALNKLLSIIAFKLSSHSYIPVLWRVCEKLYGCANTRPWAWTPCRNVR